MTNDLLEREGTLPAGEGEAPIPEETPAVPETPAESPEPREEEKTVFAPSMWSRRAARREEEARQKAEAARTERETSRREQKEDREAKKLELQLAREDRKAREEERRQEKKRQDEERRQEQKRRDEELRQARREEKAKQRTVRRVGTMTLGVSLILIGVAILLYMVNPTFDIRIVSYLAPVILIALGVEVLLRYFLSKDRSYQYDFASGLICIFLVAASFCIALIPHVMYYISPERFISEEQLVREEEEKLYRAFQGDQRVRDFHVSGGISGRGFLALRNTSDGQYLYELDYLSTTVQLLDGCAGEEEFAKICRELLDKMAAQGIRLGGAFVVDFNAPQNGEGISYNLYVNNRLKAEMDIENLAKLVTPTYSRPTRENGWFPNGYDDILDEWGKAYAEHFSDLVENYEGQEAAVYYHLLMESGYASDMAESYYLAVTGGASEQGESDAPEEEQPPLQEEVGPQEGEETA